ncbi:MAG: ribosome silencing factor [Bacteroidetes bacterium]|nr:MAG: ribosome silencing factor [Bacteroidota bacterium]
MAKKKGLTDSDVLCELIVKGMEEKKAENIVVIDLKNIKNAVADYFIVATGTSGNHADAVSVSVEEEVFKGIKQWPWHTEGRENKEWILIDYVDVVAHVFTQDIRSFYGLEQLWGDAVVKQIKS